MLSTSITVAYGDGVCPEIMRATLRILKASKANIVIEEVPIGEEVYQEGNFVGIDNRLLDSVRRTKVLLKGAMITPKNKSYMNLAIKARRVLGLYASVSRYRALSPYIPTHHPDADIVLVRELSEDCYTGIEYRHTMDSYQAMKLTTRSGCERVIRYAFEYARCFQRKRVTCFTKDNILKITDALFHQVFNEISSEYNDIDSNHYIIDLGAALFGNCPEEFDVIVTQNLYGDILMDVGEEIIGLKNVTASTCIGDDVTVFETTHGAMPKFSGTQIANPSAMINASVQMLIHIGQIETANMIENSWLKTIEDGIHTADIYSPDYSDKKVSTDEFADAIIERLGEKPNEFKQVNYSDLNLPKKIASNKVNQRHEKRLVGVDIYIDLPLSGVGALVDYLKPINSVLNLTAITQRATTVWPEFCSLTQWVSGDEWRCRFIIDSDDKAVVSHEAIIVLLQQIDGLDLDVVKVEFLYYFDDQIGFSKIDKV